MNGSARVSPNMRTLLTVTIVIAVLHYAQEVFIPLALAILLTFLLAPIVERLQRVGFNRVIAVAVSVGVAFAVIGGIVYVVFDQFTDLVQQLPRYRRQLRENLTDLTGLLSGGVSETTRAVEALSREIERVAPAAAEAPSVQAVRVVEPPQEPMAVLWNLFGPLVKPIGTIAIVIVFVIFMLLRLPDLRDRIISLLGSRNLRVTTEALDDAANRVSRYLLMQTLINSWQGLWVATGLWFLGLPNAILWGSLTVVLRFIPYLGPWVAAAMPVALSFAVFDDWTRPLMAIGLFVVLELISNVVLEPWLYGSRTGVSPVALLVAAAFWTWLWGAVGLFLAIPITVCVVVMGKYIPQLAFLQVLLGDQPVLAPHERLYQRLLSSNRDEANDLLEAELREHSLVDVCDVVIVPAMQLAENDHQRGALSDGQRENVLNHVSQWADELIDVRSRTAQPEGERQHGLVGARIACLPAADPADEITALLLAALLIENGARSYVERVREVDALTADAVVVCALPPEAVSSARTVCKKVRARLATVPILVGLWNAHGDLTRSRQRLESAGATDVLTSFRACLERLAGGGQAGASGDEAARPPAQPAPRPRVRA